tara:strand:+ start:1153 stop:1950 length:798 start_codon:yes stop_codon:yes gene_type:complete
MYCKKKIIIVLLILIIIFSYLCFFLKKRKERFTSINGINSFDKYMYINLRHRKDRKTQITNELAKMEIPQNKIIRIDAVYNKYNGHIGCCKSHIKAITLAKQMNLPHVAIFEDDFVFTKSKDEVDKKINHFLQKYHNFNVIQFSTVHNTLNDINDEHVKKVEKASTSSAYILNSNFYDKLLEDLNNSKDKMENEMIEFNKKNNKKTKKFNSGYALDQHWNDLQKKSKWYIFDPYIGEQGGDANNSSIMESLESFMNFKKIYSLNV